jgi:hypothetical protein
MMIGSATTIITASLLVVHFLDSPYENQTGSIRPAAMEQTVSALRAEQAPGSRAVVPCDVRGASAPA